jgi:hypothetical protein
MSENNFLDYTYNNKHINETDKTKLLSLYTTLQSYNYTDVFSPDSFIKTRNPLFIKTRNPNKKNKPDDDYVIRKLAICKKENRIFKIWITNTDNPFTNDVCYQMLIEYYFHNVFFNSITDNILIVPETYKYGKVILNANNEILYFYEMEYYDTEKYILDSINNLDDESKIHKINYFFDILKYGYTALYNMESRISVFQRDQFHLPLADTCIYKYIKSLDHNNMLIYNDKAVLIDFGEVSRLNQINFRSPGWRQDNSSAVYNYISMKNELKVTMEQIHMEQTLRIFDNFFDEALYNECYDYSTSCFESSVISLRTNLNWEQNIRKDSSLVLVHDLSNKNDLYKKINDIVKTKCQVNSIKNIMFYYWTQGSHIPWHNDGCHNGGITIYLNKVWDEDWGGIFLCKDDETINGFYPKQNRSIMQVGGIEHSVAPTTKNSDIRFTIQIFF